MSSEQTSPEISQLQAELETEFNPMAAAEGQDLLQYGSNSKNEDFDDLGAVHSEPESVKEEEYAEEGESPEDEQEDEEVEEEEVSQSDAQEEEEHDESYDNLRIAKGFSKIAKRDAALRRKEAELRSQEKKLSKLAELAEELERDPAAVIQKLGLDADKLYMSDVEKKAQAEASRIEALEKRIEDLQTNIKEREASREVRQKGERWESDFEAEFEDSEFSAVRSWDPSGQIVRKMVADRYQNTGKLMSPRRALQILSEEIEDRVSRLTPRQQEEKERQAARTPRKRRSARKTVSGTAPATVQRVTSDALDDEADMERITAKYMQLMQGTR